MIHLMSHLIVVMKRVVILKKSVAKIMGGCITIYDSLSINYNKLPLI